MKTHGDYPNETRLAKAGFSYSAQRGGMRWARGRNRLDPQTVFSGWVRPALKVDPQTTDRAL
jgi:hypothetical protein